MEKLKNNTFIKKVGFNRVVLFLVLLLMYGIFAILSPTFLSYNRILSALNYAYFLGFLALGVTFVIATGGIDFSIGPVMFCAALISGYLLTQNGLPLVLCLLISILVGTLFGCLNGYLVAYWNLPSFITSMASMMLAKGIGSVFTKTQSVSWPQAVQENGEFRKLVKIMTSDGTQIPTGLLVLIIASIICAIILNKTKAGRYILCIGSNKEAVRLSGVNVKKWEMLAYVICGTLAGIAAIIFVGAYSTVQPGLGDTYNNEAIAGCVMGGTAMSGGTASIGGTFLGVLIIALLQEGILAMGFQKDWQYVITGLIVLVAVYANVRSHRRKN
ncbi:ribose transport system permease protein [Lachnospiraceae bacterium PF1-21]|uniref:ABC transporter permease n=1 Tax=Ohessyouella blattaphilus TaxID=2949333 RepID=A0ABT1EJQ3_9FIRM|nr:ABC transporter permease [Ohessyouella blattaphilus]MCP1110936.1 ABC transporter permease [Ohessyouella blattaphilus]MCR8564330.1 ABC transporter permease [Ohessyouella blattaphilus]MDL2250662.1 ABC transporter permease [Lachnospiraceae bacterium OttesenSCG-928-J05]